jgi:hypothetical protein
LDYTQTLIPQIYITSIYADGEDVDLSVSNAVSSDGLDYSPVYETSAGKQSDWVATLQVSSTLSCSWLVKYDVVLSVPKLLVISYSYEVN